MVVAIEPSVNRIRFAGRLTLHDAAFAFDDGRVDGFVNELGWDEDFDADPSVLQLSGGLHSRPAREIRIVLQTDFANQDSVILDDVLTICVMERFQSERKRE